MSFFPDMGRESMVAAGDHVRVIGWLHPDHAYSKGDVSTEFLSRLKEFVAQSAHCAEALYFGAYAGFHTCEFCGKAHGVANLGVPSDDVLFIAPEMVVHYIEQHGYYPPSEFIQAVLRCPLPGTEEYRIFSEPFWQLHQDAVHKMIEAAERDFKANKGVNWREARDDV